MSVGFWVLAFVVVAVFVVLVVSAVVTVRQNVKREVAANLRRYVPPD